MPDPDGDSVSGDAVRRLAKRFTTTADGEAAARFTGVPSMRQATVSAVATSTVDVLIAGDTDVATVGWTGSARPLVGDTVWVALLSGHGIVHGAQGLGGDWTSLPLGTNIAAQGGAFDTPRYRREGSRVWLSGVAKTTGVIAALATVATLPAGFRPAAQKVYAWEATAGALRFDVKADGTITTTPGLANATFFSFDGASFELG